VLDEPRETAGERLRHAGLHQVRSDYPQPSSSSVLTLGTIGAPQESQVTARSSPMKTSGIAGSSRWSQCATIKVGSSIRDPLCFVAAALSASLAAPVM